MAGSRASLDVCAAIGRIGEYVAARARDARLPAIRLGIEPGRAIVAHAGTTIYRVLAIKRQTERTFVVVDGGIAENPRPALYGARHEVVTAARRAAGESDVTLCGRSCENDELGIVRLPRDLRSGELLAMRATGAYTYSMAGNYNRFPRPAVAGVTAGSHRLLARRESLDDVLARDDVGDAPELNPAGGARRSKDV
jgi:diaminopimelate decarboxylase